jgi:hypothetical protein
MKNEDELRSKEVVALLLNRARTAGDTGPRRSSSKLWRLGVRAGTAMRAIGSGSARRSCSTTSRPRGGV